ncbi:MAG: acetyl/propionyl/methylcrotonyl-CoA carboxylase subunit alpha [Chloroflexota bacterium]
MTTPASPPSLPAPPFRRLLIANRGEIAVRIIRACRELGIETVAVYSEPDRDALHVRLADQSVRLGPAPASESYLRADLIVDAALRCDATAIHPGYGFLSERASFAEAVEAAGIVFVGPAPATLAALGDKIEARRAAQAVGVPIVPGMFDPLPIDDASAIGQIESIAIEIGFPVLIKAAFGGGGRGMRRVDRREDLPAAIASAAHEARQAFGDGSVYLERLVEGGRHIEVQLLGDSLGEIVALGERDCSTQRRHQKLVEEAPAPGLSEQQRRDLHALAVTVASSVGLRNAATAEFLRAPDGSFYFLEVNARLQVEHGVTELVSGLDIVIEQLFIAAGQPLSVAVRAAAAIAATPRRHAIELRISAEDPAREFAPVPGIVTRWREPGGPGVRIDSGIEQGWRVSGDYDPMLAKVLVVAADRASALARARSAVAEFETGGVQTTLPFHAWLLSHPEFTEGRLRTDMVERDWRPEDLRAAAAQRAAAVVAAFAWSEDAGTEKGRPARLDGHSEWPGESGSAWRDAGRREATERW